MSYSDEDRSVGNESDSLAQSLCYSPVLGGFVEAALPRGKPLSRSGFVLVLAQDVPKPFSLKS